MPYYIVIGVFVTVCVVSVLYMLLNPKQSFINKQVIDHDEFLVHNSQSSTFQQGPNTQFTGQTFNQARIQFNMALADSPNLQPCKSESTKDVPMSYDMRDDEARKACVQPVRTTGNCTSAHVMAVVSTVEDRMCIQQEGIKFQFSTQDVISCDSENFYCNGGYVSSALNYAMTKGFI